MQIGGIDVSVEGRFIRTARVSEGYDFVDDAPSFVALLKASPARIDLLTFIPRLSESSVRLPYRAEPDNLAVVPITTYDHWFAHQIGNKTRNLVRKAEKLGVIVRVLPFDDSLVAGISALNNETPIRQNRPYWHYGDDLDTVRRKNESFLDRSVFLGAFFEGSLIGYAKLTSDARQEQAGLMQILSMVRHRAKAPTNALVAHAVRVCAERGVRYLWYARFSYRHQKPDSLAEFKRHSGFQQTDLPRYYVPVTSLGRITLTLGLHRDLAGRLPDSLVYRARELRNRWYQTGPRSDGSNHG